MRSHRHTTVTGSEERRERGAEAVRCTMHRHAVADPALATQAGRVERAAVDHGVAAGHSASLPDRPPIPRHAIVLDSTITTRRLRGRAMRER